MTPTSSADARRSGRLVAVIRTDTLLADEGDITVAAIAEGAS